MMMRSRTLWIVSTIALFWAVSDVMSAQSTSTPAFDVASIKPNTSNSRESTLFPLGPGDDFGSTDGRFSAINEPLIAYIRFAFRLGQHELLNLPSWVYSDHFDIAATSRSGATKDQMRAMMRSLLAERFKLAFHTDTRVQPLFDLVLANPGHMGPRLRAHTATVCTIVDQPGLPANVSRESRPTIETAPDAILCTSLEFVGLRSGDNVVLFAPDEPMDRFASFVNSPATGIDLPVRDRTGLSGTFDLSLNWRSLPTTAQSPTAQAERVRLFEAALEEQLGLKLVPSTGPVDVLVIDHVEHPTEN
jgi:uncharacterized protein (TIGR03435 family)